eukprot:m.31653 g.31653  ORF g.31653 m.31653 type:complete len:396 (+) comp4898_c0_seq1:33-1220(+)
MRAIFLLLLLGAAAALDPDALAQRYRGWTYYPTWVIPPSCLNAATCAQHCNQQTGEGCTVDVMQVWRTHESSLWHAVYLQYDGVGYETYMATSSDLVHYNLSSPTLAPGQPGVIFSPREGRPPSWDPKPVPGDFDYGGITFVGPLLENYTVGHPAVLRRTSNGLYWYAYIGFHTRGSDEPAPGADGLVLSRDGLHWERAIPQPYLDVDPSHGAQPWEQHQIYAPFLVPSPDGSLASFYNAAQASLVEQSGVAYLPGGPEALPGFNFTSNTSHWVRYPANPVIPVDSIATFQAADPKVYWDGQQKVWILIYFCNGAGTHGGADICIAFSEDQRTWAKASAPLYVHGGHPGGLDSCHAHKAWLTADDDGTLYLFYTGVTGPGCNTRAILLLTSKPVA